LNEPGFEVDRPLSIRTSGWISDDQPGRSIHLLDTLNQNSMPLFSVDYEGDERLATLDCRAKATTSDTHSNGRQVDVDEANHVSHFQTIHLELAVIDLSRKTAWRIIFKKHVEGRSRAIAP